MGRTKAEALDSRRGPLAGTMIKVQSLPARQYDQRGRVADDGIHSMAAEQGQSLQVFRQVVVGNRDT